MMPKTNDRLRHFFINPEATLLDAMRVIDESGQRFALVVDKRDRLLGFVSDGDIRSAILSGEPITAPISQVMNADPVALSEVELSNPARVTWALGRLQERSGGVMPLLDNSGRIVGLLTIEELARGLDGHFMLSQAAEHEPQRFGVRTILVIGGAGYLGSVLTRQLLEQGMQVRVFDLFLFGRQSLESVRNHPNLEIVAGDMRHIDELARALDGVDACVLLAAIVGDPASRKFPQETIETNYLATKAVAEACKYRQINRMIYASTCSIYGMGSGLLDEQAPLNPVSLYARTKLETEKAIRDLSDTNFAPTMLRMATLYGSSPRMRYDLVVNTFVMKGFTEGQIRVFGGEQSRPLLHVRDAARAFVLALQAPIAAVRGQVFNVGSSAQNFKIVELGKLITGLFPQVRMTVENSSADARDYAVSFEKIERTLGFRAEETLEAAALEMWADLETGQTKEPTNSIYYNHLVEF